MPLNKAWHRARSFEGPRHEEKKSWQSLAIFFNEMSTLVRCQLFCNFCGWEFPTLGGPFGSDRFTIVSKSVYFTHLWDVNHLLIWGLGHPFTKYQQDIPVIDSLIYKKPSGIRIEGSFPCWAGSCRKKNRISASNRKTWIPKILEKVTPLKLGNFLVSVLDFWSVHLGSAIPS